MGDAALVLQTVVDGVASGAILALVALGLSLVFGIARFVNVAHAEMVTAGAYLGLALANDVGMPVPVAVLLSAPVTILLGLVIQRLVYRPLARERAIALVIASIGVGLVVRYSIVFVWGTDQRAYDVPVRRALSIGTLRIAPYDLVILGVTIVLVLAVQLFLQRTSIGRDMRAVADDPDLARVAGISPARVMTWMWAIAVGLAAVGGGLLGIKTVVTPYMGWDLLLPAFAAAVLGSVGSVSGTLAGALLIGLAQEIAGTFWLPTYKLAAAFIVMTLVLLLRPGGLFSTAATTR